MNLSVGKLGAMGLCGGTIAAATVARPKTQKGEHNANKLSTALGLGSLAATPYLVKQVVKTNPALATKVATKVGAGIEKAAVFANKYGQKAIQSGAGQKTISFVTKVFNKIKGSKIGAKIVNGVSKVVQKVKSNGAVKNIATKVADALKKFAKASPTGKGKMALIAAGVGLLAYAGYKTITNFFKKEGAIDQKYKDMEIMDKALA